MKASKAVTAAILVSAIQISCRARLAFGCWLFGNLASRLPEAKPAIGDRQLGRPFQAAPLQVQEQATPIVGTFPGTVGEADEFLLALRRGPDQHENALLLVFQPRLQVNAIGPDVDVAL